VFDAITPDPAALLEAHNDAAYLKDEALRAFKLGVLSLEERARMEVGSNAVRTWFERGSKRGAFSSVSCVRAGQPTRMSPQGVPLGLAWASVESCGVTAWPPVHALAHQQVMYDAMVAKIREVAVEAGLPLPEALRIDGLAPAAVRAPGAVVSVGELGRVGQGVRVWLAFVASGVGQHKPEAGAKELLPRDHSFGSAQRIQLQI
jgi:hypothetical protein